MVHLLVWSIIVITKFIYLYVNCSYALVYVDYGVACTVMIDDHWCRWFDGEKEWILIVTKHRDKKERVVCDDPKRPCVKEAIYACIYTFYST